MALMMMIMTSYFFDTQLHSEYTLCLLSCFLHAKPCYTTFIELFEFASVSSVDTNLSYCRAIKEEKYAARRAILPMLQAEEDER